DRVAPRPDRLVERLGPLLPEPERRDVVDRSPRCPSLPQIAAARGIQTEAAVLARRNAVLRIADVRHAAILHAVKYRAEVRPLVRLHPVIHVMREAARREILQTVRRVAPAIDRPEGPASEPETTTRTVPDVPHQAP